MLNIFIKNFFTNNKVLGLDEGLFILLFILIIILIFIFLFLYFSLIFVDKNEIVIVERRKKDPFYLEKGVHFLLPLRDKIVGKITKENKIFYSVNKFSFFSKNKRTFEFSFQVKYQISNPVKYFYSSKTFKDCFENDISNMLIQHFSSVAVNYSEDIYKSVNKGLLSKTASVCEEYGIVVLNINLSNVSAK